MDCPADSCVNCIRGIIHRCLCRFWRSPIAMKLLPRKKRRHAPAGGITSANAFHSKIAADRKVEPPIPHSSVTQRWGARSINRCDHHEFAGASGAAGVSVRWGLASFLEYRVKILGKHRLIQALISGHTEVVPAELKTC